MNSHAFPGLLVQNLTLKRGDKTVVENVSFTLPRAELVGLIGPNGAGKSSLLKAMAGLGPRGSDILWQGRPLAQMTSAERGRTLAFLPQERSVVWPLRCRDVVALGRMPHQAGGLGFIRPAPSFEDLRSVEDAMRRMDVQAFADRPFDRLSGGEQARVLIARLLAQDPRLILADEPCNGLDPEHQLALMQCFRDLVADGVSVVVSLHDLTLASAWCDRLLLLDTGKLVADGSPAAVLTADRMAATYNIRIGHLQSDHRQLVVPIARL
ncbi:ATP-binding cassette domain-containing protein [Microvirga tunisiensis]|uniref:ATP-binding cassette domain-containing protein n=1 Tax=Pannonibacter tanglangensis TaxID=2750084 RepID=A0A7X5EZ20_9HYPH|nr:ABC transporter ATP-binding protein [Pannonibacter sp. XCT-53]NBN76743.1 ATP-binding cassette domain-containing protein [Pannonibacter sp. XCT-53]